MRILFLLLASMPLIAQDLPARAALNTEGSVVVHKMNRDQALSQSDILAIVRALPQMQDFQAQTINNQNIQISSLKKDLDENKRTISRLRWFSATTSLVSLYFIGERVHNRYPELLPNLLRQAAEYFSKQPPNVSSSI